MRLVIISNRLPITAVESMGQLTLAPSIGGLATGLRSYLRSLQSSSSEPHEYIWIGWPGISADESQQKLLREKAEEFHAYPVFLTSEAMENFYHGFCNKTIWALFHYFPSYAVYNSAYWADYIAVNRTFCDSVQQVVRPGDVLWVHDYHLMLLPKMLRERNIDLPIGFFLHIPFPSYEVFRLLPRKWRTGILEGLLGADLIGFHTQDYVQYFLRCVSRILGYDHYMGEIMSSNRSVKVDTFPMGIDYQRFSEASGREEVQKEKQKLMQTLGTSRVILSIDRLDYSKGILNRLQGYEYFLETNPQIQGKVVLLLVVVPSRIGVEHYERMKKEIDEFVGRLNGRFSTVHWTPILYQYRSLSFTPLVSLYAASDVILVTPLRDGMNLIAKEYIASRTDRTGVLILSEMAGAAKELGEGIIINPNNAEEIAEALESALQMPPEEQCRRNEIMQGRLQVYSVNRWAQDFLQSLMVFREQRARLEARLLSSLIRKQMLAEFKSAERRLILLDYDGTLVGFAGTPEDAAPSAGLLNLLDTLARIERTHIVVVSGREKHTLDRWLGDLPISIVAEHGAWLRERNEEWQAIRQLNGDWKAQILPLFSRCVDRLPGSFVEEKDFSLVFHYRKSDPDLASIRTKELMDNLLHFTANLDLQVLQGSKVVELRKSGVDKGTAGNYFLSKDRYDFILGVGDDWTDEDLFKILPPTAYSIKVGLGFSHARCNVLDVESVIEMLNELKNA